MKAASVGWNRIALCCQSAVQLFQDRRTRLAAGKHGGHAPIRLCLVSGVLRAVQMGDERGYLRAIFNARLASGFCLRDCAVRSALEPSATIRFLVPDSYTSTPISEVVFP